MTGGTGMRKAAWLIACLLACFAGAPPAAEAASERRVALVIGNGRYENVARLDNPGRDAALLAEELRRTGFSQVSLLTDLSREKLVEALRGFAAQAGEADWAVIYFAGHGIEANGMNYLIPVDARLATDRDLQFEGVPLNQALASVEGARKLRLLILDACRDNPFATTMKRVQATRSLGRGLAEIEPEGGTLVAYAAKHGQFAQDGSGSHGPFVTALARHLRTPGLEINRLFRRIRSDVLAATENRQEPFVYGSLPDEDFYFTPPLGPSLGPPPEPSPSPTEKPERRGDIDGEPGSEPEPANPLAAQPESAAKPSLAVPPDPPGTRPAPSRKKVFATIAPPSVSAIEPAAPRMRDRPRVRLRPSLPRPAAERPEPAPAKPKPVVQRIEQPRPSRPALRPRPAASGTHCFVFNGERVCE